jgi:nucleoside-diphosphate-sugar epimerase
LEVNPTLLIIGCGKLGIKIGSDLRKQFDVIGIKRNAISKFHDFEIIFLNIFDPAFDEILIKINPEYVIYSIAADDQSYSSYQKAYFEGLKISIKSIKENCPKFKHLFFISSTRVYGQNNHNIMTERTPPEPNDFGGEALYEGELSILESDISASILRLSGIYGEQRTRLIEMAQNHSSWPKENRWTNRIFDKDAVNFITFLLNQLQKNIAIEPLYLVTDNSPALLYDVLNHIRGLIGLKVIHFEPNDLYDGKQLKSLITPKTEFIFNYPTYQDGYNFIIGNLNK